MLYTRKGDGGTSGLFGTKKRRSKDDIVYETLGTFDELNSLLGVCKTVALKAREKDSKSIADTILQIQERIFIAQAEIAGADKHISKKDVLDLESAIALFEARIENPHAFVVAGATELSAFLDYARAVSRRLERIVVSLKKKHKISDGLLSYCNRLSSMLYVLARYATASAGKKEISPKYGG